MSFLSYLFWPRPPQASYDNPKVVALIAIMGGLVILSFAVRFLRRRLRDSMLRRLSRSWPLALLSFGLVGILLTLARTEDISFLSMRFLWVVWALAFALCVVIQLKLFRTRYYQKLPTDIAEDPRERYLPKRKRP